MGLSDNDIQACEFKRPGFTIQWRSFNSSQPLTNASIFQTCLLTLCKLFGCFQLVIDGKKGRLANVKNKDDTTYVGNHSTTKHCRQKCQYNPWYYWFFSPRTFVMAGLRKGEILTKILSFQKKFIVISMIRQVINSVLKNFMGQYWSEIGGCSNVSFWYAEQVYQTQKKRKSFAMAKQHF